MSAKQHRLFWKLVGVLIAVAIFLGIWELRSLLIFPVLFLSVRQEAKQIEKKESKMKSPEISSQVGHALAVYCQSGAAIFPTNFLGNAWLPKPVRDLNPSYVVITESKANIEMGGGFYHYGYSLERQPNSVQESNLWTLTFNSEGSDSKRLLTFATAASEKIPLSNFVANALAEYDRLLKSKQEEYDISFLIQYRIAFLIQFDRTKVRETCLKTIDDFPKRWWPRLTLAFIDSAGGREGQAAHDFAAWVDSNPSYSRYIYLAYYYEEMGKVELAAQAIEKAISYPIIDMPGDMVNTQCSGYSASEYAFRNGKYSTAIKLCDALLPVKAGGKYAKSGLLKLRDAAFAAQSGKVPAFHRDEKILPFNPYEHVSLAALRNL